MAAHRAMAWASTGGRQRAADDRNARTHAANPLALRAAARIVEEFSHRACHVKAGAGALVKPLGDQRL